jgi:hypothetical protein
MADTRLDYILFYGYNAEQALEFRTHSGRAVTGSQIRPGRCQAQASNSLASPLPICSLCTTTQQSEMLMAAPVSHKG